MQQKTITVVIEPDGSSSVDLSGFAGQGCEKTLKEFQGTDQPKHLRRKSEFYGAARQDTDRRMQNKS